MYVVGGAVRDALLGRAPRELDLVVEGDAVAVARRAAERVGGALTVHDRFGTATVLADGFAFDLAGARRETYSRPGALPDVQLGASIEEDLARRDFSVNAIALRLADDEIVEWEAPAPICAPASCVCCTTARSSTTRRGCCGSSATRTGSVSSPTRTLPALVDPAAVRDRVGERLGNELRLLIREDALAALARFGLGRALFGDGFQAAPGLFALGLRPARTLDRFGFPPANATCSSASSASAVCPGPTPSCGARCAASGRDDRTARRDGRGRAALARRRPPSQARDRRP